MGSAVAKPGDLFYETGMAGSVWKIALPVLLVSGLAAAGQDDPTGTISVTATNLRSDDGKVLVYLYAGKKGFPTKPGKAVRRKTGTIKDGRAYVSLKDVPHGTYAVSVIHDEDGDGKLDTNWLGIPEEGVGVSLNAKGKAGPPKFKDAKFVLDTDERKLKIKVRYL
jgi:uncharacterized protein (DUF2141 family)